MRIWHKKEKERLLISVFIAIILHVALFILIEYGDVLAVEEPAEFIGPMTVEISEYTVIPEPLKEQPQAEEPIEQPPSEEQITTEEEPVQTDQTEETAEPVQETEEQPAEQNEQPTTTAESEEEAPPEAEPEQPAYEIPTPTPAQEEEKQEHVFNGTDEGNEFSIQMGSISDIAKPNIGPSIADQLPQVTKELENKVEVTFSFILGPDGRITHLYMDTSSGYPEIDRAIRSTLLQWKFSRPIREERVEGEFTYVIKP